MRWDRLTGLEPETEEDRRRIRKEELRILSGFGRVALVYLVTYALFFSIPEETLSEMANQVTVAGYTIGFTALDPVVITAIAWSLSPMAFGLYNLLQFKWESHSGPPQYEWEVDQDG